MAVFRLQLPNQITQARQQFILVTLYTFSPIEILKKLEAAQKRSVDFAARHTIDLCLRKMLHIFAYDGRGAAFVPTSIRHLVQRSTDQGVFGDLLSVRLLFRVLSGLIGVCHNSRFFVGSLNHHIQF